MNNGIPTERRSDSRSELSLEYLMISALIERFKAAFVMHIAFQFVMVTVSILV